VIQTLNNFATISNSMCEGHQALSFTSLIPFQHMLLGCISVNGARRSARIEGGGG